MLKQIAWNTFKNTGDINTFMELSKVDELIKTIENNASENKTTNLQNNKNKDLILR